MRAPPADEAPREIALALTPDMPFGTGRLRPAALRLVIGGREHHLEPRVAQLLVALASRMNEVVGREELIDACWGGRVVGDDAVNRCVAKARRVTAGSGVEIETVARVGYRLKVEEESARHARRRVKRRAVAGWGLAAISAAAAGFVLLNRPAPEPAAPVVTVGDFQYTNEASSTDTAFQPPVAQDIVHALLNVGVTARLGGASNSDYNVRGAIRRAAAGTTALIQIEEVSTGVTVLSEELQLEPDEAASVADKLAASAAHALTSPGSYLRLAQNSGNAAETASILRIVSQINSGDALRALVAAEALLDSRPSSAAAPFVLAYATVYALPHLPAERRSQSLRRARKAADLASRKLPVFGDAFIAQCRLYPLDYGRCERIYRHALAADPSAPTVASSLAFQLLKAGRLKEASVYAASAFAADPFNPIKVNHRLYLTELLRQSGEDRRTWAWAQRYWPKSRFARQRFMGLVAESRWQEAGALGTQVAILEPESRQIVAAVLGSVQRGSPGADRIPDMCRDWTTPGAGMAACMTGLASLGYVDEAIDFAIGAFPDVRSTSETAGDPAAIARQHDPGPLYLLWGSAAKPMRMHPRFSEVAARAGLLDYWKSNRGPDFCRVEPAPVCSQI